MTWLNCFKNLNVTREGILKKLLYFLFLVLILYNSHRYILKIGSSDFTDGTNKGEYIATPIYWQLGKYIIIGLILFSIYAFSIYQKRVNYKIYLFYSFLFIILVTVLSSGFIFNSIIHNSQGEIRKQQFAFDELEFLIWGFILIPFSFIRNELLRTSIVNHIDSLLKFTILFVILTNLYVIACYFVLDVNPFHAYPGTFLIRFGGLWDDPNTFSILNSFLLFYTISKKHHLYSFLLIINIIWAISFTGYILIILIFVYFMIRNKYYFYWGLFSMIVFAILTYANLEMVEQIMELKSGSIDSHSSGGFGIYLLPLQQPILFHETWFLSFFVNYPPISYILILVFLFFFLKAYFFAEASIQNMFYIVFFASSWFLPFLYMFPLNIIGMIFFVLYCKKIYF